MRSETSRARLTAFVLFGALVSGIVPTASAASEAAKKKRAKAEAEKATVSFKLSRFEDALHGYEKAYEIYQASGLLFNIAQCHRQLGHHEKAIFFFTGYLRDHRHAKNADQAAQLLEEEKQQVAALEAQRTAAASQATSAPVAIVVAPASLPSSVPAALVQAPFGPEVVVTPVHQRWWFWVAVVGGAAVVAAAVAVPLVVTQSGAPAGTLGRLDRSQ
jgi:tetratricopeptide (TPR) repeat protein